MDSFIAEVIEDHTREHIVDPAADKDDPRRIAAEELGTSTARRTKVASESRWIGRAKVALAGSWRGPGGRANPG